MKLKYHKLRPEAITPAKKFPENAGWDLFSCEEKKLEPSERYRFNIGLVLWWEPTPIQESLITQANLSWYGRLAEKSGLAAEHGLRIGGGVIDRNYRGEIGVVVTNTEDETLLITPGQAICQIIPVMIFDVRECEMSDVVEETDRGASGFGSRIASGR